MKDPGPSQVTRGHVRSKFGSGGVSGTVDAMIFSKTLYGELSVERLDVNGGWGARILNFAHQQDQSVSVYLQQPMEHDLALEFH